MNRRLVRTPAFIRAAKRFLKRHPEAVDSLAITLAMMEDDVFHRRLRTHKLQGD
jgi:mRNA-degrading endonuclease YafQ of YafQ-DinJ toxin-antitoxin module